MIKILAGVKSKDATSRVFRILVQSVDRGEKPTKMYSASRSITIDVEKEVSIDAMKRFIQELIEHGDTDEIY